MNQVRKGLLILHKAEPIGNKLKMKQIQKAWLLLDIRVNYNTELLKNCREKLKRTRIRKLIIQTKCKI